jgi:hypothetical protein
MSAKNGLIGLAALVVIVVGAVILLEEANDGPLENAAEDIDNATDDIADDVEDAAEEMDDQS